MKRFSGFWIRTAACAGTGAGVFLGLGPVESSLGGTLSALCLIYLYRSLKGRGLMRQILWSSAASFCVSLLAFQWTIVTVITVGHLNFPAAFALFTMQSVLFNLKIPLFIIGADILRKRTRVPAIIVFPALAAAGDMFCFQVLPWYWGNLQFGNAPFIQSARLFGVYGVSALMFLQAALLYCLIKTVQQRGRRSRYRRLRRALVSLRAGMLPALVVLAVVYLYGFYRLGRENPQGPSVNIGFIQPATGMGLNELRDDADFAARALNVVFNAGLKTIVDSQGQLDLLIIPESSVPFFGTADTEENRKRNIYSTTFHAVVAFLSRYGRLDVVYNELDFRSGELFNLATIFGREGKRRSSYQKQHLLPFGEYLPGERIFTFLRRLFPEASSYSPGTGSTLLEYRRIENRARSVLPDLSQDDMNVLSDAALVMRNWPAPGDSVKGYFAPLVCYEGMFPDLVRSFFAGERRPDFLLNISNDSWFGDYLENYQHSTAVKFRAVETGLFLVRITLSGVSTVTDPAGRDIMTPTRPGAAAYGAVRVPVIRGEETVYLRLGDGPLCAFLAAACIAVFIFRRRSRD